MQETKQIKLKGANATKDFASGIGARLRGGEVFELIGDLGAGKTTFVIGLVKGANIDEPVSSPSFTIRNDYVSKKLAIAHYDFFRLSKPGELSELLNESVNESSTVSVIEWPDTIKNVLPDKHVKIEFVPQADDSRLLKLSYAKRYEYLFATKA